jgi:hypothetical protein
MLTKEQIAAITDTYARRWNTTAAWNVKRCIENALIDALALLARQPAAIDKQEAAVTRDDVEQARDRILEQSKNSLFRSGVKICAGEILSPIEPCDKPPAGWTCSRTKGHEGPCAASFAAPSVEQDDPTDYEALEREHLGDAEKRTGIYAPSVEQDERGAFEAWCQAEGISPDKSVQTGVYSYPSARVAWRAWQARAASTSAKVAQGAEALTWRDVIKSYPTPDMTLTVPPAQTALKDDVLMQAIADTAARGHVWASRALSNFRAAVREAAKSPNDA